jgi:hypothetical protein
MVGLIEMIGDALVLLVVLRLAWRVIQMFTASSREARPRPQAKPERSGGTLVRCPQCGTFVPESRTVRARAGSDALEFCSTACRDQYAARPVPSQPSARVH